MQTSKLTFGLTAIDYGFSLTHQNIGDSDNIGYHGKNLTIVVLSCNRSALTIRLVDSLIEHVPVFRGEVLIYDNASDKDDLQFLEQYLNTIPIKFRLIKSSINYGVAGGRNRAIAEMSTEWLMILDNDIYFTSNPLAIFKKNIAALGCKFLNLPLMNGDARTDFCNGGGFYVYTDDVDKSIWGCSMYETTSSEMDVEFSPSLSSFLFGGASIIKKEDFFACGGFDEGMFVGFEDLDFSIALFRKGYKIGSAGVFALVHDHKRLEDDNSIAYEKTRFSNEKLFESALYFEKKHGLKVWSRSTVSWIKKRRKELGIKDSSTTLRMTERGEKMTGRGEKRSVLFCIQSLGGGGAEKLLIDILHRLNTDAFDIDVCVISRGGVYYKDLPDYVNYYVYYELDAFPDKKYDVEIAFLEGEPTKLVALHPSSAVKIAWVHTDMYANRQSANAYKNLTEEAFCYSMMDHIVFVAQTSMLQFEKLFPDIQVSKTVIYNMIIKEAVISKSQAFSCPIEKTKLTMCTLSRLIWVKGVERLIPVLSRLKNEGFDFHHWIIGDGFQKKTIQQLIEKHDLKNTVFLLGFQKNPFPYLKVSDIFVSTSLLEGLPLALGEALCLGIPVIATNVSGSAEILGYGAYGMLVESNEDAIYMGLKEMIINETLRNEYAQKAETGSNPAIFDIPKTMNRINELLYRTSSVKTPVDRIANQIFAVNNTHNNPGLKKGKMSEALFFFHYAKYTGNKIYEDYAFDLINEITGLIHKKTPVDYETGLAGIGAGIEYLAQNGFIKANTDDVLEEIEEQIYLAIPYETDGKVLAGIGHYLLFRIRNPESCDAKLTTLENKRFLIHIIDLIERFYTLQSEENIPYIYRFLSEVDKINIFPDKVKRLIKDLKSSKSIPAMSSQMDGGLIGDGLSLMGVADKIFF